MLLRLWAAFKLFWGMESTVDLLNLAIKKLVTPDIQAQLTALILEMADLNLTGSEKKVKVIERFEQMKASVLGNFQNLKTEAISTAIDLIVNYLRLIGELNYSAPPPK